MFQIAIRTFVHAKSLSEPQNNIKRMENTYEMFGGNSTDIDDD